MIRPCLIAAFVASLAVAALAEQPATQPVTMADIEMRANQAFANSEYATALPLLQKVAAADKDQPDKLGPIEEMIRVAQKNLPATPTVQTSRLAARTSPGAPVASSPSASAAPSSGVAATDNSIDPSTDKPRVPHPTAAAGQVQVMAIKDLGNFAYDADKGGNIPSDVKAMTGSVVRLHGFMIPMDQAERITKFALVPSLFACCYGQPPQIQHTIVVDTPSGKAVSYFADEISVEGTLSVEEKKEDDIIVSIFEIHATSVKPMAK